MGRVATVDPSRRRRPIGSRRGARTGARLVGQVRACPARGDRDRRCDARVASESRAVGDARPRVARRRRALAGLAVGQRVAGHRRLPSTVRHDARRGQPERAGAREPRRPRVDEPVRDTVDAVGRAFATPRPDPARAWSPTSQLPGSGRVPGALVDRAVRDTVGACGRATVPVHAVLQPRRSVRRFARGLGRRRDGRRPVAPEPSVLHRRTSPCSSPRFAPPPRSRSSRPPVLALRGSSSRCARPSCSGSSPTSCRRASPRRSAGPTRRSTGRDWQTAAVPAPRRVAILGGGIAGLAAAWELSRPELGDDVGPITVYQRGWRLGGKGASWRGEHGRIEEHGLHVWLGYYENAFRLVRECYAELDRPRTDPDCPIGAGTTRSGPRARIGLGELHDGEWLHWLARFDENGELPGEPDADRTPMTPGRAGPARAAAARRLRRLACSAAPVPQPRGRRSVAAGLEHESRPAAPRRPSRHGQLGRVGQLDRATRRSSPRSRRSARMSVCIVRRRPLDGAASALLVELGRRRGDAPARRPRRSRARRRRDASHLALPRSRARDRARHRRRRAHRPGPRATPRSTTRTTATGSTRHGAGPETIESPLVRVVYDLVFGYEHGDDRPPAVRGRHRSPALGEDVLRLPRRGLLEDDRGDGRRGVRTALRRAARPRRASSDSSTASTGSD